MASAPPNFNARRAPNVSQYLANLNTIPSAQELAAQNDIPFNDSDLDFLAQTEFFDFDQFNHHAVQPEHFSHGGPSPAEGAHGKGVPMSGIYHHYMKNNPTQ